MFDKERKIIRKLDDQIDDNKYILYLTSKEYEAYKQLLKDFSGMFLRDLPIIYEQKGSWTGVALGNPDRPAPTYKGYPIKIEEK